MNEQYKQKIGLMLSEIDRILNTENLRPTELQKFFGMQQYLGNVHQAFDSKDYQSQLGIEAYKRLEKDLGPIVGEIRRFSPGLLIARQYGGVKTYEEEKPGTAMREFESNINYDMERGFLQQPQSKNLLKKL